MTALNMSYRPITSAPPSREHERACQAVWNARCEKNGDIYLDNYAGWYSVRQEAYFDEEETTVGS